MKPAADFLELVSDVLVKKPRGEHLHGMFLRLLFELDAQAEGTAGKALVAVIRAKAATYVPMKDTLELMWHVQLFVPGTPIHRSREYCERERQGKLAGAVVRWALNFDEDELTDNEWAAWLERRQSLQRVSSGTGVLAARRRPPTVPKAAQGGPLLPGATWGFGDELRLRAQRHGQRIHRALECPSCE